MLRYINPTYFRSGGGWVGGWVGGLQLIACIWQGWGGGGWRVLVYWRPSGIHTTLIITPYDRIWNGDVQPITKVLTSGNNQCLSFPLKGGHIWLQPITSRVLGACAFDHNIQETVNVYTGTMDNPRGLANKIAGNPSPSRSCVSVLVSGCHVTIAEDVLQPRGKDCGERLERLLLQIVEPSALALTRPGKIPMIGFGICRLAHPM